MFRRLDHTLPKDPHFPAGLGELGYFINETNHIKRIDYPDEDFQFWISTSGRYNDLQREAMHSCIRREVSSRLTALNIPLFYLPQLTTTQPDPTTTASLPIHCTPPDQLRTKKHIIIIVNRAFEDLAIHSYRVLSKSGGIDVGSCVGLVKSLRRRAEERASRSNADVEDEMPGVVILNPGQTLYSYKKGCAVTLMSWDAMPRKSCVYPAPRVDDKWNRIAGNEGIAEHIEFVFERLLGDAEFVRKDAELYFVGLGDGGEELVKHLEGDWPVKQSHVTALALTAPFPIHATDSPIPLTKPDPSDPAGDHIANPFLTFLAQRTRAWSLSDFPTNTPLANSTPIPTILSTVRAAAGGTENKSTAQLEQQAGELHLCPTVSGGDDEYAEVVICRCWEEILDWLEEVAIGGGGGYVNPKLEIPEEVRIRNLSQIPSVSEYEPGWGAEGGQMEEADVIEGDGGEELPAAEDVD